MKWENCPGNFPISVNVNVSDTSGVSLKFVYSGYFNVSKDISGPLELLLEINRCDLTMTKCEKLLTQKFPGVCQKIKDKNSFYYQAVASVQPAVTGCPFKANIYAATNSTIDLKALTFVPISNSLWLTTSKIYSGEGKEKQLAMCTNVEARINRVRNRKKN